MKKIAKAIFMFMFTLFSVAYFHNNFDYGSPSDDNIIIIIGGVFGNIKVQLLANKNTIAST